MTERFIIGCLSTSTSAILLNKAELPIVERYEKLRDILSWLTLYQGDGSPRSVVHCFEPKPKWAKNIKEGDVFLNKGSACSILKC